MSNTRKTKPRTAPAKDSERVAERKWMRRFKMAATDLRGAAIHFADVTSAGNNQAAVDAAEANLRFSACAYAEAAHVR